MGVLTPRLGLDRPVTTDGFETIDHYNNLTKLDGSPGEYICTSGTRPAGWGASHTGMCIYETDSGLVWRWNGTIFARAAPIGLLGDPAVIVADFATASTTPLAAISTTITVPETTAGSTTKRIRVAASWYGLDNGTATTLGACEVSIYRNSTQILKMLWRGRPTTDTEPLNWGTGGTIEVYDAPSAGSTQYSLRVNSLVAITGTTTLRAAPGAPAQLSVTEVGL